MVMRMVWWWCRDGYSVAVVVVGGGCRDGHSVVVVVVGWWCRDGYSVVVVVVGGDDGYADGMVVV